jgi:LPS-assembly protein
LNNKSIIRKILFLSFLLPLAIGMFPPYTWAESESTSKEQEPVNLTADRMFHLVEKNMVKAEGHVVVTYGARTVSADEIIVNTETGKGQAKGNVIMTAEQGTKFQADKAQFNVKAEKGRLFNVAGKLGDLYYITGEEVTKLSETHYTAQDATLTTCTGDIPDWRIDVADTDVILDDRAWFAGGVFRIKNIPIMYIPVGYVPIITKRKSGLLAPRVSTSNVDGETVAMTYFWAINQWADATIGVDYIERRGIRARPELRFAPSKTTYTQINANILDDRLTNSTFWKLDATHRQHLPLGFKLNAKLDQTSKANFNKTFQDETELRTRRSSDSYATFFRKWDNQSFDILARFRESEQPTLDETFGLLPTVTYKTQPVDTGLLNAYFDQETSYTHFLFDADPSSSSDITETSQRFDFHPSLALPINIAPWLNLTSRVGFRETFYNKEIQTTPAPVTVTTDDSFSRELIDMNVLLEGPKFNRIFLSDSLEGSSFKHVIEPRLQYDYIPDIDRSDRKKIRLLDGIDAIENVNKVSFFLAQRLLRKGPASSKDTEVRQIARLELSQSYDIDEARGNEVIPGTRRQPFSPIRFDLDSKLSDNFFLNTDFTYNVYDDVMETWNVDVGVKLNQWLMLIFERREKDDESASILGTLDVTLPKGWNAKYSLRYDEFKDTLLEHNARLTYNDKCMCWGFTIDYINREIFAGTFQTTETRILFGITLRGLGDLEGSRGTSFIHRSF